MSSSLARAKRRKEKQLMAKGYVPVQQNAQIINSVDEQIRARRIARKADAILGEQYRKAVFEDAMKDFDLATQSLFFMSFALAVKEKFPHWGADAVEGLVQKAIDWNLKFIKDFNGDPEAYMNHYAITIGRPFGIREVDEEDGEKVGA